MLIACMHMYMQIIRSLLSDGWLNIILQKLVLYSTVLRRYSVSSCFTQACSMQIDQALCGSLYKFCILLCSCLLRAECYTIDL